MNDYERKHLATLKRYGAECTVLLKSNMDFPLSESCEIALYGSGARNTINGGIGSGEVNSRFFSNIEKSLEKSGFTITTQQWLDSYDLIKKEAYTQFIKDLKAKARANRTLAVIESMGAVMPEPSYQIPLEGKGDVAIYVLSRISGEGSDRESVPGDILLSDTEIWDIHYCKRNYKKFMLVLNTGGPVDLTPVISVKNILLLSQLGVVTGEVLTDILLGKESPSGKLTTTWANWEDYSKIGEFGDIDETRYREGVYIGYRYFDTIGKEPMFPFGFGLSFTSFIITNESILIDGETIEVSALVENTGGFSAKEVVQLYVSPPQGILDKPYQTIVAFEKTRKLAPGEKQQVHLSFKLSDIASYDEKTDQFVLDSGDYILHVGNSSRHTNAICAICIDELVVIKQVKASCGKPDFLDWIPSHQPKVKRNSDLKRYAVSSNIFKTEKVGYEYKQEIDEIIQNITDEELIHLNMGDFDPKGGRGSIIGSASDSVAGAAGETTGILKDKNFPVLVMADGPAGLRLSEKYIKDEKGVHPLRMNMLETTFDLLPGIIKWWLKHFNRVPKPKKGQKVYEQFATALPIGTAIAQSFNLEFAYTCGDIVGSEMELFGVHLWLAPALNIHRDIRCGRNFEYFSEDPLISGKFSSAITHGVQSHPGCGVTIKHYVANNQELNRYNNNSQVSERAMREIYLKGFEICVKEAQPKALMTSYNLLNGIHTSESSGLIQDILRCEYGYKGIVMTDWVVNGGTMNKKSIHPRPYASKVASAGGDLFMPGSKNDYKEVLKALDNGAISKKQLQINATRVHRLAKELVEK